MNLALFYSFTIHFLLFCVLIFTLASKPIKQNDRTMYTIDFIGQSDEVLRYGAPQQKSEVPQNNVQKELKEQVKEEPKQEVKTEIKAETQTKNMAKEYNSKTQISTKTNKKQQKKKKKIVLSKPSILDQVETDNLDVSALHSMTTAGQGGAEKTVQASFTNFPYPWYITQVRNALWTAWQKNKPKNAQGLSSLISFNVDKNGAVFEVQLEKSSGDEAFDYAALNAARNAGTYPPLPEDFKKDILTVTVEFKQEV